MGSKPAPHPFVLEVFVEATSQGFILVSITYEARVVLNGSGKKGVVVLNECV